MFNFHNQLKNRFGRRPKLQPRSTGRFSPKFETLELRQMLAVTAVFAPTSGVLSVYGDSTDNTIEISRNATGGILVNNGAVTVLGGTPSVANTSLIQAFGLGGNDTISLNEANGLLPRANLYGGSGIDTLTGGSGADLLFGQSGEDTIQGKDGADMLFGGSAADTLTGGDGDDQAFGQSNDDQLIWNPGDDSDLKEGGAGVDRVEVNGGNGDEVFTTTANGTRVRFDRLSPGPFFLDIGTSESLVVNMNGGQDSFSATGNLAALIQISVDGGAGNDTILGSNGMDLLIGGDGDDFVDGQQGNDVAILGADNDTFQWDPGDGSDRVEGQAGADRLLFNGSAGSEVFAISPNAGRVQFTRNLGAIAMDLDDVETFDVNAFNSTDSITINDLTGTDVTTVNINLTGTFGGSTPDGQADNVIVNGTSGEDTIFVAGSSSGVTVSGLAATINIVNAETALDRLTINGLGGDDVIDASSVSATAISLTLDGGEDDDVLIGGDGADTLLGGNGDDVLLGGPGVDILDGGTGDNVVIQ